MGNIEGLKIIRISTGEEVDYIFTDMGDVPTYPNGKFFTSKLEISGKTFISKVQYELVKLSGIKFRFSQDLYNFEKQGYKFDFL